MLTGPGWIGLYASRIQLDPESAAIGHAAVFWVSVDGVGCRSADAMANWVLRFISGKYQGSEFPLEEGGEYTIGRSNESSLVLVEDMVSRNHARILVVRDQPILEDLKSTNGSFVNGERVDQRADLNEGDRVLFGTSIIKLVRVDGQHAAAGAAEFVAPEQSPDNTNPPASRTIAIPAVLPSGPSAPPPGGTRHTSAMNGLLEEVPLPDLLQLFSTTRKTGVLKLARDNDAAALYLREGRVVYGAIDSVPVLSGEKAAYRIMTWDRGNFVLEQWEDREFPDIIELPTESLLMEAMRLQDELENLRGKVPSADIVVGISAPLAPPLRSLTPELLDTLQLVINHQQVQQILDHSLATDLETLQDLGYLLKHSYIVELH